MLFSFARNFKFKNKSFLPCPFQFLSRKNAVNKARAKTVEPRFTNLIHSFRWVVIRKACEPNQFFITRIDVKRITRFLDPREIVSVKKKKDQRSTERTKHRRTLRQRDHSSHGMHTQRHRLFCQTKELSQREGTKHLYHTEQKYPSPSLS